MLEWAAKIKPLPVVYPLEPLLLSSWKDLHDLRVLWQILVIAISAAFAWWTSRLPLPKLVDPDAKWQSSVSGLRSVRFPLTALALVLIGRWVLAHYQNVSLLDLAVPLLVTLAIIHVIFYVLPLIFGPGTMMSVTLRAIAWLVWIGFALYITGLAPELLDFLEQTGLKVGKQRVSLLLVLQTILVVAAALILSLWLSRILEGRVMAASIDINLRVMLAKIMRPLLVLLMILITLPMVGIDLTALSVFGGAIGVGIGFGLQKIASNYISGFIILLDRSVTIGDFLTIEKNSGQLTKMTARYVVIRNADGTEVIIPNETVITSIVINHSYSNRTVRVPITVQISHGSDLDTAMRVLVDTAQAHPRALKTPAPQVLIKAFTDNGIELELGVWVQDPEDGSANLRSDIYLVVWREFKTHGIEIPYPQREVRVLNDGALVGPGGGLRPHSDDNSP